MNSRLICAMVFCWWVATGLRSAPVTEIPASTSQLSPTSLVWQTVISNKAAILSSTSAAAGSFPVGESERVFGTDLTGLVGPTGLSWMFLLPYYTDETLWSGTTDFDEAELKIPDLSGIYLFTNRPDRSRDDVEEKKTAKEEPHFLLFTDNVQSVLDMIPKGNIVIILFAAIVVVVMVLKQRG